VTGVGIWKCGYFDEDISLLSGLIKGKLSGEMMNLTNSSSLLDIKVIEICSKMEN
jgi:hypothetical protein